METRDVISQQEGTVKAPVSFHDFAARFSKEEWKLLHEWQTDLYEIVMNEIQQAITSLGPVIATTVFSLRPPEKQELFHVNHQESNNRCSSNCSPEYMNNNSDMLFKNNRKPGVHTKDAQDTHQWESQYCATTGFPYSNSDIVSRKDREFCSSLKEPPAAQVRETSIDPCPENVFIKPNISFVTKVEATYFAEHQAPERAQHVNLATIPPVVAPAVSFCRNDDDEAYFMDQQDAKSWGSTKSCTEHSVNTPVVSFKIKEEDEPYYVDCDTRESINDPAEHDDNTQVVSFIVKDDGQTQSMQQEDSDLSGNFSTLTGDRATKRKRTYLDSEKCTRKASPYDKAKTKVFQSSQRGKHSRKQFSESYHELRGELASLSDSGFISDAYSNLHPGTAKEVVADKYNDGESDRRKKNLAISPQKESQFTNTSYEDSVSQVGDVVDSQAACSRLGEVNRARNVPYQCPEFETNLAGTVDVLIAEKPYTCAECHKRFRNMSKLIRHQITHSKERHYQCTVCGKSYNRSDNLIRHQRSHTRDFQAHLEMWPTAVTQYDFQN